MLLRKLILLSIVALSIFLQTVSAQEQPESRRGRRPPNRPARTRQPGGRQLARPAQTGQPSMSMATDPSFGNAVTGLALRITTEDGPSISMDGAVTKRGDYLRQVPFELGTISTGGDTDLLGQQANSVTNKLTFGKESSDPNTLAVYVARLSPALLIESKSKAISFFGEGNSPSLPKPLRWATPGPDGKILTGVISGHDTGGFPQELRGTSFSRTPSLAPDEKSSPPPASLNSNWLLLWYGSDSPFASTKMPFIDWKMKAAGPKTPFWPLDNTVFQADVPLMLVFQKAPCDITIADKNGLEVTFPENAGRIAFIPVFGHNIQYAEDTEKWLADFPDALTQRCDTWAKCLAKYPVNVTESVSYDAANDTITHKEDFEFVEVRSDGQEYAPLPAMLALALNQGFNVEFSSRPIDLPMTPTAFGPASAIPGNSYSWTISGLGRYITQVPTYGPPTPESAPLEKDLIAEVDKVLAAGHMAPMFYVLVSSTEKDKRGLQGSRYWTDCSEQLYLLAEMLPLLPPEKQEKLREYMRKERQSYPPETVLFMPSTEGARRERYSVERTKEWVTANDMPNHKSDDYRMEREPSIWRAYGLSRYYQAVSEKPDEKTLKFCRDTLADSRGARQWDTFGCFKGKYSWNYRLLTNSSDHQFTLRTVNRQLAGVIGCIRLSHLASEPPDPQVYGHYAHLTTLRFALGKYAHYQAQTGLIGLPRNLDAVKSLQKIADFTKPQNFSHQVLDLDQHQATLTNGAAPPEPVTFGSHLIVYRDMVPEVAAILADRGLKEETKVYLDHYAARTGTWYVLFGDAVDGREMGWLYLADHHQLFTAHAWILGTPPEKLTEYIDIPYGKFGDLFYIHKLAETIKAYRRPSPKQPTSMTAAENLRTTYISIAAKEELDEGAFSTVSLHLRDKDTNEPVSARIGFCDPNIWQSVEKFSGFTGWGIKHQPWWHAGGEIYWYVEPDSKFKVPSGKTSLIINRGIEYVPQAIEIDVKAGETMNLDVALKRWINMAEKGWYCADTHLHMPRFSDSQNGNLFSLFEAEGLNAAPLVDWAGRAQGKMLPGWGGWEWTEEMLNAEARKGNFLIFAAQDWAWPKKSCVLKLLGHRTPIHGQSRYSQDAIIKKVIEEGGISAGSIGQINAEAALTGNLPAAEVFGIEGFMGVLTWYDLLNVGARVAAIAGTDVQSKAEPQLIVEHYVPPGADRFYAYMPEGLSKNNLIRAIAAGRTFVTNGPALFLTVNAEMPGGDVILKQPEKVRLIVQLDCAAPVGGTLYIVGNGKTAWKKNLPPEATRLQEQIDVPIEKSCWLAARFESPNRIPGSEIPKAHTSPIYITVADKPVFEPSSYQRVLDRIPKEDDIIASDATDAEKDIAIEWANRARRILQERRKKTAM